MLSRSDVFPCYFALLVLCTQVQSRNSCALLSAAFSSTQQFDAPLSGIAFATPICTPAVTLLLPNLLSCSLLPAAAANIFSYISNLNRSPSPPLKKCTTINRLQALHVLGLFLLNLLHIDFFFIFSQSVDLGVFQHLFFFPCCSTALTVFSSKQRYPELPRQCCDWLLRSFAH